MKAPLAVALLVAVGIPVAFMVVFIITQGMPGGWMETICQGEGNLACDVGIWHNGPPPLDTSYFLPVGAIALIPAAVLAIVLLTGRRGAKG